MKLKKMLIGLLCLVLIAMIGCSNQTEESSSVEEKKGNSDGPVEIVWWHSMSGEGSEALDELVAQFNESQEDIKVEAIFQGSYEESLTKLKTSLKSNSGPTIMQANFVSSGPMIDTKKITPIQEFVEKDNYDLSKLEDNILAAYEMNDQLYSMPFNASTLILYYNKDMFKENGVDPDSPPETYEEVKQVAEKLTKGGKYGASFGIDAWFIEQFIARQGEELVNNENGRAGLPTESFIDSEAAVTTFSWWKDLVDSGVALNLGTKNADTHQAFLSEEVGMTLASTAGLTKMLNGAEGKFEVGTAFLPYPEGKDDGGVSVSGASLYIMNDKSEEEQDAAWEFIKYLMEPEQQAFWYVNTGYFPVAKEAYEESTVIETTKEYPQFETAVNQLQSSVSNNAGKGAVMGVYPDARTITVKAMEKVINGEMTPEEALQEARDEITTALERYNKTVE